MTKPEKFNSVYLYPCPAKINLTLDILSRRPDGYHELASVVHQVGLFDDIRAEFIPSGSITFSCDRRDLEGDDNLCVKAVKAWNKATGDSIGATIHLKKRIPTGAGLGGGSSNAAAMLMMLHSVTENGMTLNELMSIGAALGADVPLFIDTNAVLMEGIGEKITPLKRLEGWVVIIKPELSLSTPAVYRAWDKGGFESERATAALLENWDKGLIAVSAHLGNDLARAAAALTEVPTQLTQLLKNSGALGAQMSGSGSACFGIFESEDAARGAEPLLRSQLAKDVLLSPTELFVAPLT